MPIEPVIYRSVCNECNLIYSAYTPMDASFVCESCQLEHMFPSSKESMPHYENCPSCKAHIVNGMGHISDCKRDPAVDHNPLTVKLTRRSELHQHFFSLLHQNQIHCLEMLRKKNADYVHQDPDPFINFRNPKLQELLDKLPCSHPDAVEVAIFEQISIKFNRIANLLFSVTAPANERLEDSFDDIMNYTNLLKTYRTMNPRP